MKKNQFKIKKYNPIFNFMTIGVFSIGIVASFFIIIFNNKEEEGVQTMIDPNEFKVEIYEIKENRITDYNTFFSIEEIIKDIFKNLKDKKYDLVYNLLSKEYKEILTLEQFIEKIDNYSFNTKSDSDSKFTVGRLNFLYKIETGKYLADVDYLFDKNNINISFNIFNNEYSIEYFDILRGEVNE